MFQILTDHLRSKIEANVCDLAKRKVGSASAHASVVVSSLAIAVVLHKHEVLLKMEEVISLLSCLGLEFDSSEKKCAVYGKVLREFSTELRA